MFRRIICYDRVTMRIDDDHVKKATTQHLHWKYDLVAFEYRETVDDYALRLNGMAAHHATLGEVVKECEIITKILHTLPPRFKQISIAIKTLLGVSMMTVTNLIGRLKEAEEAFEEALTLLQQDRKLYLTKEEWDA
jgi:hypothetical protein